MRVILTGASGRMGRQMLALFQSEGHIEVIAVDKNVGGGELGCIVARYSDICDVKERADAIVDFSLHTATCEVVESAVKRNIPRVVATTGHTAYERGYIENASAQIPVFMASNMSIAIAYIKDFSAAVVRAAQTQICGIFNLPGFKPYSLDEMVDGIMSAFAGKDAEKRYRPDMPDTPQILLSGKKSAEVLGWKPQWTWEAACQDIKAESQSNPIELMWGPIEDEDRIR